MQVSVKHGPASIGANTTLKSSLTSIAYLPSDSEATFFVQQLQRNAAATGIAPDLVSEHGSGVVIIGVTTTPSERAAIEHCLT